MTKQSMLKLNYLPENSRNKLKLMNSDKNFFFFRHY